MFLLKRLSRLKQNPSYTLLRDLQGRGTNWLRGQKKRLVRHTSAKNRRREVHSLVDRPDDLTQKLHGQGYAFPVLPATEIDSLLAVCRLRFENTPKDQMRPQEGNKLYYLDLLKPKDYDPNGIFVRFALCEALLRPISAYLRTAAYLQSVELIYSTPRDGNPPLFKSQLWHLDRTDRRIVKVFISVTVVGEHQGPLSFIPRSVSSKVPLWTPGYMSDEMIARYIPLSSRVTFVGPPGSILMMDASKLYHCGSRCEAPRLTFVAHYNSGFGYFDSNEYYAPFIRNGVNRLELNALQRAAINLDD